MRVSPPPSLRLRADALLADVLARLATRLPGQAADPTDPGWLLLEQAAWMVEQLSASLDDYPMAVVQQLLHIMGAELRPALPALGVACVSAERGGVLDAAADRPSPLRLFAPQTEDRDQLEFAPVERGVSLRRMRLLSLSNLRGGELFRHAPPAEPDTVCLWARSPEPSTLFRDERVLLRFVAADPAALRALLETAIAALQRQRVGWLQLQVEEVGARTLTLAARIDPIGALTASSPTGRSQATEMSVSWGPLDDSTWTPPLRLNDHPALPLRLRGRRPLPGFEESTLVLPPLPPGLPFEALFATRAAPAPTAVCLAIWTTLTRLETRLLEYRPTLQRRYAAAEPAEPVWVGAAIDGELWAHLPAEATLAHLRFGDTGANQSRVGVILQGTDADAVLDIKVYAEDRSGQLSADPLPARTAFRLPCPSPDAARGLDLLVALDVEAPPTTAGLLVVLAGHAAAVVQNPLLVIQAPAVRDGRTARIARTVPEAMTLLHPDVIGPAVRAALAAQRLPAETRALVSAFPIARFTHSSGPPILDFAGVSLDSTQGELLLNGRDGAGQQRELRQGDAVTLDWYRRTDGARGNIPAGALRNAEIELSAGPLVGRATNPLATWFGVDRESDSAVMARLFGPPDGVPVLPADFERLFRAELGPRAAGWILRVWTYAERSLQETALWPIPPLGQPDDAEVLALRADLEAAGPEILLVVVGPTEGHLSAAELDWARHAIRGACARVADRIPTVRDALVGRCYPLRYARRGPDEAAPSTPCWAVEGLRGRLTDVDGRQAAPPRGLLLNATVVAVEHR